VAAVRAPAADRLLPQRVAGLRRRLLTAARCAVLFLLVTTSGCGEASTSTPARVQTIALNWHEAPGPKHATIVVDVRRLVVRANGWSLVASVKNDTRVAMTLGRPHHPGGTEFGLLPVASTRPSEVETAGAGVFASDFAPRLPRALRPGETWSGTFSGRGRLSKVRYVRIELGTFTTIGPARRDVPWRFRYITDHVARVSR
jgi:hypothetical protein